MRIKTTTAFFLILSLTATIFAQLHPTGMLYESEMPDWMQPSPVIPLLNPAEDSCDNSAHLPPVGNQGSQGSCVAWAAAYYYKTYEEWEERGWDVTIPSHQFSPAFMYNLINRGRDGGSWFTDAARLLLDMGCATMDDMPYNQNNFTAMPDEEDFFNGIPFRCEEYYYLELFQVGLNDLKNHLMNGRVAILGIQVYSNFDNIRDFDYTYCLSQVYGENRGGHAVTLCGFDDNRQTADGLGAFKLVNSWGAGWGQSGYFYMSYQAVLDSVLSQGKAYYAQDRIGYAPSFITQFHITHDDRYAVRYAFGIGNPASPQWEKNFFDWNWRHFTPWPFPETDIILDLTDGVANLNLGGINNLYVKVLDAQHSNGLVGDISFISVEYLNTQATAVSFDLPVPIPDDSSWAQALLTLNPTAHPAPPANLEAVLDSVTGEVTLSWTLSGSTEPFRDFFVYRDGHFFGSTSDTCYSDSLITGGTYTYAVTACYDEGQSAPAGPVTLEYSLYFAPPVNLTADLNPQNGAVHLDWEFSTLRNDFRLYKVFRDSAMVAAVLDTFHTDHLPQAGTYAYNVTAYYSIGESRFSAPASVTWGGVGVAYNTNDEIPGEYAISGVQPNPFNCRAEITFTLPREGYVQLAVYDIAGREVAALSEGCYPAGTHQAVWDASKVASGVYFARLTTQGADMTKKLLLIK